MTLHKFMRRKSDGVVIEVVKYGEADGSWSKESTTRVAAFLLGFDPDNGTSIQNERMLDVVRPIYDSFDPINRVADIEVYIPSMSITYCMKLGVWLGKDRDSFFFMTEQALYSEYVEVAEEVAPSEFDALSEFLYKKCFDGRESWRQDIAWRNIAWRDFANDVAEKLLKAGWSRKKES